MPVIKSSRQGSVALRCAQNLTVFLRRGRKVLNVREIQIEELIAPTVESLGCEVWGIEYLSQGKYSKLLIYIDREDGIDVDLCAAVSRHVSDLLDI